MTITVTDADHGTRADVFLSRHTGSRSAAERLIESGAVTVSGGGKISKSYRVSAGETISFELPAPTPPAILPEKIALDVVYEDSDLIVVNKPKGMVVHPAPGHYSGTLVNALLCHCGDSLSGIGGELRPGIVHRIDKDTSGLLIAAKNDFAHRALSAQLADRTLSRIYETIVVGAFKEDSGIIDLPIGRSPANRKKMAVVPGGRRAVTRWERIARYSGYSHLRCSLETGRTHQIRVHLAKLGHPVLGDPLYGSAKNPFGLEGQCLHARELRFIHPRTAAPARFEISLPDYFTRILAALTS
jgi:23S rRNA pseudouridine1911/1915/1917 synthase